MTIHFAGTELDCMASSGTVSVSTDAFDTDYSRSAVNTDEGSSVTISLPSDVGANDANGWWFHARPRPEWSFTTPKGNEFFFAYDANNTLVAKAQTISSSGGTTITVYDGLGASDSTNYPDESFEGETGYLIDINCYTSGGNIVLDFYRSDGKIATASLAGANLGLKRVELFEMHTTYSTTQWSEIIVADEDTRGMRLLTLPPVIDGVETDWAGDYRNIDETDPDLHSISTETTNAISTFGSHYIDPHWSNVALLLPFEGDFEDRGPQAHTITLGGTPTITTNEKFGVGAGSFSGTYLGLIDIDSNLGTSWTVDAWVYPRSTGGPIYLCTFGDASAGAQLMALDPDAVGGNVMALWDVASDTRYEGTTPLSLNLWHHVAFVYDGSKLYLFLDGNLELEQTVALAYSGISRCQLFSDLADPGGDYTTASVYVDEMRITRATARWTAEFVPPQLSAAPPVRDGFPIRAVSVGALVGSAQADGCDAVLRIGGTNYTKDFAHQDMTPGERPNFAVWNQSPATASPFTYSELVGLEFGVKNVAV